MTYSTKKKKNSSYKFTKYEHLATSPIISQMGTLTPNRASRRQMGTLPFRHPGFQPLFSELLRSASQGLQDRQCGPSAGKKCTPKAMGILSGDWLARRGHCSSYQSSHGWENTQKLNSHETVVKCHLCATCTFHNPEFSP